MARRAEQADAIHGGLAGPACGQYPRERLDVIELQVLPLIAATA
jgi:hypothetical protein